MRADGCVKNPWYAIVPTAHSQLLRPMDGCLLVVLMCLVFTMVSCGLFGLSGDNECRWSGVDVNCKETLRMRQQPGQ